MVYKYPLSLLFPWQQEVFNCDAKYRILDCGRGSGKTQVVIYDLMTWMTWNFPNQGICGNAAIICPKSKDQTINVYWERLIETCEQWPNAIQRGKKWHNDSKHIITLANRMKVLLFSGSEDAAEAARGVEFIYLAPDEMNSMETWVWDSVFEPMTIRRPYTRTLFASTPGAPRTLFHRLYLGGLAGAEGDPTWKSYRSFHSTSYDNPLQDREGLDALKAKHGEDSLVWRREYMAEFVGEEGMVFSKFSEKNLTTKAIYFNTDDWTTYAAVDFGFSRGITILFQVNRFTNNINIFGEYYNENRGFGEVRPGSFSQKQHLLDANIKYRIHKIFVDSAGNQRSQETGKSMVSLLQAAGLNNVIPVPKTEGDIRDYTEQIRCLVQDGEGNAHIFMHPQNCRYGVECMQNLTYPDPNKRVVANQHQYIKGKYDHWVDAFRYAIKMLFPINTGKGGSFFVELA